MKRSHLIEQQILTRWMPKYGRSTATGDICRSVLSANMALEALENVATSKNPMETDARHYSKVAGFAKKLAEKNTAVKTEIVRFSNLTRERLNQEIRDKARLAPTTHAAEIRSVLRGLAYTDRIKAVGSAFEKGDAATLAAIFEANEMMTGIPDDLRDRWQESHQHKTCPELVKDLEALNSLMEEAGQTVNLIDQTVQGAFDPQFVRDAEEAEKKSNEADAKFQAALSEPINQ